MQWSDIEKACLGKASTIKDFKIKSVSTDTRNLKEGDVFVALVGPTFNGHNFIEQAISLGASAIVCSETPPNCAVPFILVENTQDAYGKIARYYREIVWGQTIVGITGSVGKTSTKEMLYTVLSKSKNTQCTFKNENNEIGVPKTLLGLNHGTEVGIIEMGACHPGDISHLVGIAEPNISIVTACAPVHIEFYPDLESIAREKGQIYSRLSSTGIAIINIDDPFYPLWHKMAQGQILTFGLTETADVKGTIIEASAVSTTFLVAYKNSSEEITLHVPGKHMVSNALSVISCALSLGLTLPEIKIGLESYRTTAGRLKLYILDNNALFIDDAYNANPTSVKAAIDVLVLQDRRKKWLVLGNMTELGEFASSGHKEIGKYAKSKGVDTLLGVGELAKIACESFGSGALSFVDNESLIAYLDEHLTEDVCCLVKGSCASKTYGIVTAILDKQGAEA